MFLVYKLKSFFSFSEEQNVTKWERRSLKFLTRSLKFLTSVRESQKGYKTDYSGSLSSTQLFNHKEHNESNLGTV